MSRERSNHISLPNARDVAKATKCSEYWLLFSCIPTPDGGRPAVFVSSYPFNFFSQCTPYKYKWRRNRESIFVS